jgi:hypothetical protein
MCGILPRQATTINFLFNLVTRIYNGAVLLLLINIGRLCLFINLIFRTTQCGKEGLSNRIVYISTSLLKYFVATLYFYHLPTLALSMYMDLFI